MSCRIVFEFIDLFFGVDLVTIWKPYTQTTPQRTSVHPHSIACCQYRDSRPFSSAAESCKN